MYSISPTRAEAGLDKWNYFRTYKFIFFTSIMLWYIWILKRHFWVNKPLRPLMVHWFSVLPLSNSVKFNGTEVMWRKRKVEMDTKFNYEISRTFLQCIWVAFTWSPIASRITHAFAFGKIITARMFARFRMPSIAPPRVLSKKDVSYICVKMKKMKEKLLKREKNDSFC